MVVEKFAKSANFYETLYRNLLQIAEYEFDTNILNLLFFEISVAILNFAISA